MLDKWEWSSMRDKVINLPAANRIKELKILRTQTVDKKLLAEMNELIDKAKFELQIQTQKEDDLDKILDETVNEKLKRLELEREAERQRVQGLEDAVKDIPGPPPKDEFDRGVEYHNQSDNQYMGHQGDTTLGPAGYKMPGEKSNERKRNVNPLLEELESEHKKYRMG